MIREKRGMLRICVYGASGLELVGWWWTGFGGMSVAKAADSMNLAPNSSSPASLLRCLPILALLAAPFPACHANAAPASSLPTINAPVVDIEVEDRSAQDKSSHVAKLTLVLVDHHVKVAARDGDAKYELAAHMMATAGPSADPHVAINLQRGQADRAFDLSLESSIAAKPGRVVVAKVDRADGRTTTVTAQYH